MCWSNWIHLVLTLVASDLGSWFFRILAIWICTGWIIKFTVQLHPRKPFAFRMTISSQFGSRIVRLYTCIIHPWCRAAETWFHCRTWAVTGTDRGNDWRSVATWEVSQDGKIKQVLFQRVIIFGCFVCFVCHSWKVCYFIFSSINFG
jgi:hypothetical protein